MEVWIDSTLYDHIASYNIAETTVLCNNPIDIDRVINVALKTELALAQKRIVDRMHANAEPHLIKSTEHYNKIRNFIISCTMRAIDKKIITANTQTLLLERLRDDLIIPESLIMSIALYLSTHPVTDYRVLDSNEVILLSNKVPCIVLKEDDAIRFTE